MESTFSLCAGAPHLLPMRVESGGAQAAGRRPSLHGVGGRCDSSPPLGKAGAKQSEGTREEDAGGGWVSEGTPWAHLDFANPPPARNAANCSLERLWYSDRWELRLLGRGQGGRAGAGPPLLLGGASGDPRLPPRPPGPAPPCPEPSHPQGDPQTSVGRRGGAATGPGRRVHRPRGPGGAVAAARQASFHPGRGA